MVISKKCIFKQRDNDLFRGCNPIKMKKILILSIVIVQVGLGFSQSAQFSTFINNLPVLDKHTKYQDFPYGVFDVSSYEPLSNYIPDPPGTIRGHFDGKEKQVYFVGDMHYVLGKYQIHTDPNMLVLLTRSEGNPGIYKLVVLNDVSRSPQHIVITSLRAQAQSDGDISNFFAFRDNLILSYSFDELSGIGAKYEIDRFGRFVLLEKKVFEDDNYQDVFDYPGN